MAETRTVSGSELARIFGITRQAISKAKAAGRIVPVAHDEKGWPLYDLATVNRIFAVDSFPG